MTQPVLIAGAGPTGLAAALFLARADIGCRIVDRLDQPTPWSKALAVNPRTLELLENTDVTARILDEGKPIRRMRMARDGETLVELDPSELTAKYPMVALPQSRTEVLLAEALAAYNVEPERGVELTGFEQAGDLVRATLRHPDGTIETVETPILFGADGAHSRVREVLGLDFPGSSVPESWKLVDVKLERAPEGVADGLIELHSPGFVFALAFDPTYWRVIANHDDPMNHIPGDVPVKEVVWSSDFHISHRIASKLQEGRVAIGGDAAHLHSPIGARGMNLGIEDAYVFSEIVKDVLLNGRPERLADYGGLRHEADHGVVQRVEMLTNVLRGEGLWAAARGLAPGLAAGLPKMRHMMEEMVTGQDHPLKLS